MTTGSTTTPAIEPEDDDDRPLAPWTDPSLYRPVEGADFWLGTGGEVDEPGPLRGWWIRRLYSEAKNHAPDADEEVWVRMILWLAEAGDSGHYIRFLTPETFTPGGSPGCWRVHLETLKEDLPDAFRWAAAAVGASEAPDIDTLIKDPGRGMGVAPREPHASDVLQTEEAKQRLCFTVARRRKTWPRECRGCGASFRPENRRLRRCLECRKKAQPMTEGRAAS
jgi:hypothetical protein